MNKFRNVNTIIDGIKFASKREATRYSELKLLEKGKAISGLRLQVKYVLTPAMEGKYRKERASSYVADFVYLSQGQQVVEDCKGMKTPLYVTKRKLMLAIHGISIFET